MQLNSSASSDLDAGAGERSHYSLASRGPFAFGSDGRIALFTNADREGVGVADAACGGCLGVVSNLIRGALETIPAWGKEGSKGVRFS